MWPAWRSFVGTLAFAAMMGAVFGSVWIMVTLRGDAELPDPLQAALSSTVALGGGALALLVTVFGGELVERLGHFGGYVELVGEELRYRRAGLPLGTRAQSLGCLRRARLWTSQAADDGRDQTYLLLEADEGKILCRAEGMPDKGVVPGGLLELHDRPVTTARLLEIAIGELTELAGAIADESERPALLLDTRRARR